jgi:hypothetical protein
MRAPTFATPISKELIVPTVAALVTLVVHLIANAHYGFFRDELYFIICGRHPDFGYVDQPPVVPLLAAATQVFGDSLFLLRAVPALLAAASVFTTCLLVTEFGGGLFAQAFAALIFLFTGVLASFGGKVATDEIGLLTWPLIALWIVRIAKGANPRLWIAVGIATGVSIESKYMMLFYIVALAVGVAATSQRRLFASPFFALGCGVAFAIALPNLIWQWQRGFPMFELLRNGQTEKNLNPSPLLYLVQEVLITSLFLAPVWMIGEAWLLKRPAYRFLGIAFVVLIAEMIVLHGKHYYPASIYTILIAAGAVPIEGWTRARRAVRVALAAFATLVGIAFFPFSLPVLPEAQFAAYAKSVVHTLHVPKSDFETERLRQPSPLPGNWADMHGWPELARTVERVYDGLPPNERARAVVLASNYGEASAIAYYTPRIPVISGHNQFWLWGLRGHSGDVLVQIGGTCFASQHLYAERRIVARTESRWAIGFEQHVPIAICSGPRGSLARAWPDVRLYR